MSSPIRTRTLVGAVAALAFALVAVLQLSDRGSGPATAATGRAALVDFSDYQQGRGGPELLDRAEATALAARERDPADIEAIETLARVALSRHAFRHALEFADQAAAATPDRIAPIGLRADALIELGRYPSAFTVTTERLRRRPDLESYARASYARELQGDVAGALDLMSRAAEAGTAGSWNRSWAQVQLALLQMRTGDLAGAERTLRQGQAERPADPELVINLGRLAAARGDLRLARRHYLAAIDRLPDADHHAELAEIETALGHRAVAGRHLTLAGEKFAVALDVEDAELERSVFLADWTRPGPADVERARLARQRRPSILGDSALAWVLARSGRCDEALPWARRSLRLGTRDPLLRFRAGWIAACAGEPLLAVALTRQALALSSRFSVRFAPVAQAIVAADGARSARGGTLG